MNHRWIEVFPAAGADTAASSADRLGAKGAALHQMAALGLPVPAGFTVTTDACTATRSAGELPDDLSQDLGAGIATIEAATGRRFGDAEAPLLVSVRSGAQAGVKGMMLTVLDVGLNETTVDALGRMAQDALWAWRAWVHFIRLYGDAVLDVHHMRLSRGAEQFLAGRRESELDVDGLKGLGRALIETCAQMDRPFPLDPAEQLRQAVQTSFRSYDSHHARYSRKRLGIPDDAGSAINIQAMVHGDWGDGSGSGLLLTRDPATGRKQPVGKWHPGQVGTSDWKEAPTAEALEPLAEDRPSLWTGLVEAASRLETRFSAVQQIAFTVERDVLWLLETVDAPMSAHAAVQVAVDFVAEGRITEEEAVASVDPRSLESVLRPIVHPDATKKVIARGLDASAGAGCGRVVFDAQECQEYLDRDEPTILVRMDTAPEDIQGMSVAAGVLTSRGGQTSHAAVVARGMGKPCVVGCTSIQVDYARELFYADDTVVRKGDWITIDGGTGEVMQGQVQMIEPETNGGSMSTLLRWADQHASLKVRANADTGLDATRARQLGAVGVGLCRTEHMFFQTDALRAIRRMILADDPRARQRALSEILPIQRDMFLDIFRAMEGLPVTIRLLDPPLHEFLPAQDADLSDVAKELGVRASTLHARLVQLHEANPMMGHRGVRVGITSPEVYQTQTRALFEAACTLVREGVVVQPEILIPLVGLEAEVIEVREGIVQTAEQVIAEFGQGPDYTIGVMIELPRACLRAGQIAPHCDFFSFGTNDLTQLAYGMSRDDMAKFFPDYQRGGLMSESPLAVFDIAGVGELVELGTERGRRAQPRLVVGVCGEHGGDPIGVAFFHRIGVDYVSCSPYRVPVARLAAAHAALGLPPHASSSV